MPTKLARPIGILLFSSHGIHYANIFPHDCYEFDFFLSNVLAFVYMSVITVSFEPESHSV